MSMGICLQINGELSPECCLFMGIKFFKLIDNQPEDIALQSEVINSVSQKADNTILNSNYLFPLLSITMYRMDSHCHGAYGVIPQAAAGFSQLEHGKGHESQHHFSKGPL